MLVATWFTVSLFKRAVGSFKMHIWFVPSSVPCIESQLVVTCEPPSLGLTLREFALLAIPRVQQFRLRRYDSAKQNLEGWTSIARLTKTNYFQGETRQKSLSSDPVQFWESGISGSIEY